MGELTIVLYSGRIVCLSANSFNRECKSQYTLMSIDKLIELTHLQFSHVFVNFEYIITCFEPININTALTTFRLSLLGIS